MRTRQKRQLPPIDPKGDQVANELLYESACGETGLMAFTPTGMIVDGELDTPEFRAFLEENGVTIKRDEKRMCG